MSYLYAIVPATVMLQAVDPSAPSRYRVAATPTQNTRVCAGLEVVVAADATISVSVTCDLIG